MKKNIKYGFGLCVILLLSNCENNNNVKIQAEKASIYGNWMLEDLLQYVDSSKSIIGHKQFFCSEIIIQKNADSAFIINGDKELWKSKIDSINENERAVGQLSNMPHSNLFLQNDGRLFYYDSAAKKDCYFIKTKNNPIAKANIDLSAIKYEINKILFDHHFIDLENKNNVYFNALNEVKGLHDFTNYQTFINNDKTRLSESNLIEFNNFKSKKNNLFIWEFKKDTLMMFNIANAECKDCKPYYEKGELWKSFVKQ